MANQYINPMTRQEILPGCQGEQVLSVGYELADAAQDGHHTKDDAATLRDNKARIALAFATLETMRNGDACAGCPAITTGEQAETCFTLEPAITAVDLALRTPRSGELVGNLNSLVRQLAETPPQE